MKRSPLAQGSKGLTRKTYLNQCRALARATGLHPAANGLSRGKPTTGDLFGSDLDSAKSPAAPADFRNLDTWESGYFDAVVLDGPYKLNGTATKSVDSRYGVDTYAGPAERHSLIQDGMTECMRVLKVGGILLVKCQDQVCSGRIWWQTDIFTRYGESLGLVKVDRFDMLGTGRPQPERTRADGKPSVQQHAYGRPSTLLVFRKGPSSPEAML